MLKNLKSQFFVKQVKILSATINFAYLSNSDLSERYLKKYYLDEKIRDEDFNLFKKLNYV